MAIGISTGGPQALQYFLPQLPKTFPGTILIVQHMPEGFTDMFARSGFAASRDIAGIILNRWGHAYASPAPGFYFGKDGKPAPGDVLRAAPFGRIAFANTDLSGMPDHKSSIIEANRAVAQLLDQVLES